MTATPQVAVGAHAGQIQARHPQDGGDPLADIHQQHREPENLALRTQRVGRARIAAAHAADIDTPQTP
jgi:hypothetical protein